MTAAKKQIRIPRVFISYSWTSEDHVEWVVELAQRLRANGVDVKLDKWDLKGGQDIYDFMESMVRSEEVNKVLVICDAGYKNRAEQRLGGVGTETQIISPEVYGNVTQEKFVPIVAERDDKGKTYIPTFMRTRKYIDLSNEETFEKEYETLLRNLYERPEHRKPALGEAPSFLFEDEPDHYKTANLNKQIRDAVKRNPARLQSLNREFVDCFFENLEQFQIESTDGELDEIIVNKIADMLPLRDDFIEFIEGQCLLESPDVELIIDFFERIIGFTQPSEHLSSWHEFQWDHYKFLVQEMFLYAITVLINNSQYATVGTLLRTHYFVRKHFESEMLDKNYSVFNFYTRSLDELRKQRLKLNRISLTADILSQRATLKKYPRQKLVQTDLLLHYIGVLEDHEWVWFPRLYVFGEYKRIELLQRLKSKRHFDRVKQLFNVSQPEDLKQKFSSFKAPYRGYQNSFTSIPNLSLHIKSEEIYSIP